MTDREFVLKVIEMRTMGYTEKQIADHFNLPCATLRYKVATARKNLKI